MVTSELVWFCSQSTTPSMRGTVLVCRQTALGTTGSVVTCTWSRLTELVSNMTLGGTSRVLACVLSVFLGSLWLGGGGLNTCNFCGTLSDSFLLKNKKHLALSFPLNRRVLSNLLS